MIYFHLIFDLKELYNLPISYSSGFNHYIGKLAAILFIIISGISSYFGKNNLKRGLRVLAAALIITLATYLYDATTFIKFGILHFLGVAMLLSPFLLKLNNVILLICGAIIIAFGSYMPKINTDLRFLFPFGIMHDGFSSNDYYPLIPWLGVFMLGTAAGKFFYKNRKSLLPFSLNNNLITRAGRHTLIIYLVHQPVILLVLYVLNFL